MLDGRVQVQVQQQIIQINQSNREVRQPVDCLVKQNYGAVL
jgi:hypothetical protein